MFASHSVMSRLDKRCSCRLVTTQGRAGPSFYSRELPRQGMERHRRQDLVQCLTNKPPTLFNMEKFYYGDQEHPFTIITIIKPFLLSGFRQVWSSGDLSSRPGSRDKAGAERELLRTEGDNYCRELLDHDYTGSQPIYNCEDNTVNPHHELKVNTPLAWQGCKLFRNCYSNPYPRLSLIL